VEDAVEEIVICVPSLIVVVWNVDSVESDTVNNQMKSQENSIVFEQHISQKQTGSLI